ncbi:MAG: hypothetical protein PVI90_07540 [Desulfobacteraceae bacterium]|jgi:hypothetical protein
MKPLKWIAIVLLITGLLLTGCGNKAEELFDTAKFEELQNNPEHALSLYQEIVDKYPSNPLAEKAKLRISEIKKKTN